MPCAAIAARSSGRCRLARMPPCTAGCSVLTRPSIISGKPVTSETFMTGSPAPAMARSRAAGRDELDPQIRKPLRQVDQATLVRDTQNRAHTKSYQPPASSFQLTGPAHLPVKTLTAGSWELAAILDIGAAALLPLRRPRRSARARRRVVSRGRGLAAFFNVGAMRRAIARQDKYDAYHRQGQVVQQRQRLRFH